MDFALTDDLQAVAELGARVMREHADPARLRTIEAAGGLDTACWQALADTGLLGVGLPESDGGSGLGWMAVHLLLEAAGEHVAHVPLWETLTAATMLAEFDPASGLVGRAIAGEVLLTLALQDVGAPAHEPVTVAAPDTDTDGVRLTGTKVMVPWADESDHLVVSASPRDGGRPVVAVVDRADVVVRSHRVSSDVPHGAVELDHTPGRLVGEPGGAVLDWLLDRAVAGLASLQSGMLSAAVRLSADHTSTREQFGRPLATFQAVSQRVASAFIDAECAHLTALHAAWRLHEGLPAGDEVAIAKWWAAEAGHRVLHAAQHVHGGVGVDRDYPLHRYLLRTKQVEFALGSAPDQLGRLGASLAADPA